MKIDELKRCLIQIDDRMETEVQIVIDGKIHADLLHIEFIPGHNSSCKGFLNLIGGGIGESKDELIK